VVARRILQRWLYWALAAVVGFGILVFVVFDVLRIGSVAVPPSEPVTVVTLEQNWQSGWDDHYGSDWYHHADQGTRVMRYKWFMALEQPDITVFTTPAKLSDPKYLVRFGFLVSERNEKYNPDNLPIGFSIDRHFLEPYTRVPFDDDTAKDRYLTAPYAVVGLTCAACHTGQWNVNGKGIRIEGGPALVNLALFQDAIGRALYYTTLFPTRFRRFAREVLGADGYADPQQVAQLREDLSDVVSAGVADREYADKKGLYKLSGGFGRTDALGLIANRAFKDFKNPDNLAVADAPVSFPPIWDAPWFDWVQYNGSIRLPMVRNIGEVLGVGGLVNIDSARGRLFPSTVNVGNLHWMEAFIAGPRPFAGLGSPKWPKHILGEFDSARLEEGRKLYQQYCIHCHATVEQLSTSLATRDDRYWHVPDNRIADGHSGQGAYIRLNLSNLDRIGTDPAQALNLYRRVVHTDGARLVPAAEALEVVTGEVRDQKYKQLGLNKEQELEYDGFRRAAQEGPVDEEDDSRAVVARLGYKARPLNGVWATAPYLHNGSVPNLYEVLSPQAERSKRFFVGSKSLDTKRVGIVTNDGVSNLELDTSLPGNLNKGHEFRNLTLDELERWRATKLTPDTRADDQNGRWAAALGIDAKEYRGLRSGERESLVNKVAEEAIEAGAHVPGVLGRQFSADERLQLVEYLKSL
jgi:mono/diheme cytochrome c family protein